MRPKDGAKTLVWILGCALVLRVVFVFWWQARLPEGTQFFFGDSESYWELGQTIAFGEPYQFRIPERRVFRTPGFPTVLAPLFMMGGREVSPFAGRMVSVFFGTLSVGLVWLLARKVFDQRAATMAGWMAALYPGAISTSGFVLSEALFGAIMLGQLFAWISMNTNRSNCFQGDQKKDQPQRIEKLKWTWAIATGVAAGIATLVRPSWFLFTLFAVTVLVLLGSPRKWHLKNGLLALLAMSLFMLPWCIRNANVIGKFVPTSLQIGASLYDGLNPTADGSSDMEIVQTFENSFRQDYLTRNADATVENNKDKLPYEYQLDKALLAEAIQWAKENPKKSFQLAFIKFFRLWNIWPNEPSMRSPMMRAVVVASYGPVMLLAMLTLWRHRSKGWHLWLLVLPAVYFTMLHVLFVSSIRYRQPAMLALMVLASGWFERSAADRNKPLNNAD